MWSAIDAVKEGEASVAVSCGNTGALMAVSMLRLRKLPGVNRPAIDSPDRLTTASAPSSDTSTTGEGCAAAS